MGKKTDKDSQIIAKIDRLNEKSWELSRSDAEKSYKLCREAGDLASSIDYKPGLAFSLLNKGWYFVEVADYAAALKAFEKAKILYSALDDAYNVLKCYAGLCGVHYYMGQYEMNLRYNAEALELARKTGNVEREITVLISMSQVYDDLDRTDDSLRLALEALEAGRTLESFPQEATLYLTLADAYIEKHDYEQSLYYLEKGLSINLKFNNREGIFSAYSSMGEVYAALNRYDEAEKAFKKGLAFAKSRNETILYELAHFYYECSRFDEALDFAKQSLDVSVENEARLYIMKASGLIAEIYEKNCNFEKALYYLKESNKYEKIINNEESERRLAILSVKFKVEETQRENEINRLHNLELTRKNEQLSESRKLIASINDIGRELTSTLDMDKILTVVHDNLVTLIDSTAFGLALYDEDDSMIHYKLFTDHGVPLPPPSSKIDYENSLAGWCIRNNKEIFVHDLPVEYSNYTKNLWLEGGEVRSLIFVPLSIENKILGILTIQHVKKNAYSADDLETLRMLASFIAISIENAIRHDEIKELNVKLEEAMHSLWSEMQIAKKIQTILLPENPVIDGFEITAYMRPADMVGGDYYDFINAGETDWVIIGDVSGHGIPAGLVMMMVQTSINMCVLNYPSLLPSELLSMINRVIHRNISKLDSDKYMTLTAMARIEKNRFVYSGLHLNILIYRGETGFVDIVETNGMWIGLTDNIAQMNYDEYFTIDKGDVILLYTDGISEARKEKDNRLVMFGQQGLINVLRGKGSQSTDMIREAILDAICDYLVDDDITLVVMKCME